MLAYAHSLGEGKTMKLHSMLLLLCLACVTAITARGAAPASSPDEEAIKAGRTRQNAAMAESRIDEVASYWTDDVTICRGLGVQLAGKAAYRKLLEGDASASERIVYARESSSIEASPLWPLAFETGTWSGHLGSVKGPTVISGRYSAQWVKRDEKWLIRAEVFVALNAEGVGRDLKAAP